MFLIDGVLRHNHALVGIRGVAVANLSRGDRSDGAGDHLSRHVYEVAELAMDARAVRIEAQL